MWLENIISMDSFHILIFYEQLIIKATSINRFFSMIEYSVCLDDHTCQNKARDVTQTVILLLVIKFSICIVVLLELIRTFSHLTGNT